MLFALVLIGILLSISTLLLIRKYLEIKSLSILGSIIPRIYTVAMITVFFFAETPPDVIFIHVGIMLVLTSDIINSFVERYTKEYRNTNNLVSTLDALADMQDKFYLALENAQVGYYIINGSGRFEYVNKIFSELTGYSRKELLSKSVFDISYPEDHTEIRELIDAKIFNRVKTTEIQSRIIRKDGTYFLARIVGTRTENGHPTITGTVIELEDSGSWITQQL